MNELVFVLVALSFMCMLIGAILMWVLTMYENERHYRRLRKLFRRPQTSPTLRQCRAVGDCKREPFSRSAGKNEISEKV